ncbi:MAG: hypothetical protein HY423_11030 [Candidatus Lambdaproteobacteria bacterium]|nr:hypothetical protein [Candidatus Lambdaproteobacteria bacterium]
MKDKKLITEDDVLKALEAFKARGGLIKKLPDEIVPRHALVGAKFGAYENVLEGTAAAAATAAGSGDNAA